MTRYGVGSDEAIEMVTCTVKAVTEKAVLLEQGPDQLGDGAREWIPLSLVDVRGQKIQEGQEVTVGVERWKLDKTELMPD